MPEAGENLVPPFNQLPRNLAAGLIRITGQGLADGDLPPGYRRTSDGGVELEVTDKLIARLFPEEPITES